AQERDVRVDADLEGQLVEVRHSRLEVVRAADQSYVLTERPFVEHEAAGPDRLVTEVARRCLDRFLRYYVREVEAELVKERRVGHGGRKADSVVVDDLDACEVVCCAVNELVSARDGHVG